MPRMNDTATVDLHSPSGIGHGIGWYRRDGSAGFNQMLDSRTRRPWNRSDGLAQRGLFMPLVQADMSLESQAMLDHSIVMLVDF